MNQTKVGEQYRISNCPKRRKQSLTGDKDMLKLNRSFLDIKVVGAE